MFDVIIISRFLSHVMWGRYNMSITLMLYKIWHKWDHIAQLAEIAKSFTTLGIDFTTLSFGTAMGFPAILLPQLRDPNSTIKFTREEESWIAGALCVISHIMIAGYLYGTSEGLVQRSTWLPMLFLSLQLFSNAVGIVPIRIVIGGELFPLKYRGIGGSITSASGSIFMFIFLKTFPALVDGLHLHGAYVVYGSIVVYNLVILWFMLPETKGRTLLEIEEEFSGKKPDENDAEIAGLNVKNLSTFHRGT